MSLFLTLISLCPLLTIFRHLLLTQFALVHIVFSFSTRFEARQKRKSHFDFYWLIMRKAKAVSKLMKCFWDSENASLWFLFLCSNHHDPEHHHSGILVTFWFDSGTLYSSTLIYQPPRYYTTTQIARKGVWMLRYFLLGNIMSSCCFIAIDVRIFIDLWIKYCVDTDRAARFIKKDWAEGSEWLLTCIGVLESYVDEASSSRWWEERPKPLLFEIQNWAVAVHLSKTGNFMFPLLLIATACITLLLHIFTHTHTYTHTLTNRDPQKRSHSFTWQY